MSTETRTHLLSAALLRRPSRVGRRLLLGMSLVAVLGLLSACRSFKAEAPVGFAPYKETRSFRAVSPDGVVFRVRTEKNEPKASLNFWKEALKKRMQDAGYHFVREGEVKAGEQVGYLLELSAPLGTQDYSYLIAVFDQGERLVLVESAGEIARFAGRRDAVVTAIGKLGL